MRQMVCHQSHGLMPVRWLSAAHLDLMDDTFKAGFSADEATSLPVNDIDMHIELSRSIGLRFDQAKPR